MTPPDSVGKVVAEMLQGGGTETGWIGIDTARGWADRLQALARGPQQAGGEDYSALKTRLRDSAMLSTLPEWCRKELEQGADAIAALQAEVARLTADRDSWCDQASDRLKDWDEMRQRAEAHLPSTPQSEGREMLDREVAERLRRARQSLIHARVSAGFQDAGESARDLWELEMECRRAG